MEQSALDSARLLDELKTAARGAAHAHLTIGKLWALHSIEPQRGCDGVVFGRSGRDCAREVVALRSRHNSYDPAEWLPSCALLRVFEYHVWSQTRALSEQTDIYPIHTDLMSQP